MKIEKSTVIIVMLLGIVFVSGCEQPSQPAYIPKVDFIVSPTAIDVNDNQISNLIAVTITKKDTENKPTNFVLKFTPSNPDYAYPIDAESNEKVEQKETGNLTTYGREFKYQFKVFGKKVSGQPISPWKIDIELLYNNTTLNERSLDITVK